MAQPTRNEILTAARAYREYTTGGCCKLGVACELCDCGRDQWDELQMAEDVRHECALAEYVLGKVDDAKD